MPIYEYRCTSCQHAFSKLQRISSTGQEIRCPQCGSIQTERQMSTFASGSSSSSGATSSAGPSCTGFT